MKVKQRQCGGKSETLPRLCEISIRCPMGTLRNVSTQSKGKVKYEMKSDNLYLNNNMKHQQF